MNRAFDWKIEYIDRLLLTGDCIQSPSFFVEDSKTLELCFKLFPKCINTYNNTIDLLLCKCDKNSKPFFIEYELCMESSANKAFDEGAIEFDHPLEENKIGKMLLSLPMDTTNHCSDPKDVKGLNILEIKWKITGYSDWFQIEKQDLEHLSLASENLLHQGTHSDLCLQIGNKVFNVHRSILEARCAVLANKLQTIEKLETLADPMDFEILFNFLYTGKINSSIAYEVLCTLFKKFDSPLLEKMTNFHPTHFSARTVLEMERYSFVWNIHNFMDVLTGEIFSYTIAEGDPSTWVKLSIFLDLHEKDRFIIMIHRFDKCFKMSVRCIIKIYYETSNREYLCQSITNFELPMAFEFKDIKHIKEKCLKSNALKLHVNMCIYNGKYFTKTTESLYEEETSNFKHLIFLGQDLKKLFKNSINSDVALKVKGIVFPAHKAILSARSPVFASMFQHDTSKTQNGEIIIEDARPEVISSMLYYMYCGQTDSDLINDCDLSYIRCMDLYCTARKYEVHLLLMHCSATLQRLVTVNNAGVILGFADTYCKKYLKPRVIDFVCRNCHKVLQSAEWKEVMSNQPELLTEVLEEVNKFERTFQFTVNGNIWRLESY